MRRSISQVKSPQVLSHLLWVVAIQLFLILHHFPVVSPVVSLRCVSPGAFATAHRPDRSEQWSCGGEQFQAPPRWDTTGAIDFPAQIVQSPQILSHVLLVVAIFPLPHTCAIRFPKSNPQTPTSPISSAFSGRYSSLAAPVCHVISQVKSSNLHKSYLICF